MPNIMSRFIRLRLLITTAVLFLLTISYYSSSSCIFINALIDCGGGENRHCSWEGWIWACRCRDCQAGNYCNGIWWNPCEPGTFSGDRASMCTPCSPGTASDKEKTKNKCPECPRGTESPTPGAEHCEECGLGMYANETKSWHCKSCPVGHYCNEPGTVQPKPCRAGQYMNDRNWKSSTCKKCLVGSWSGDGFETCVPCTPGTFNPANESPSIDNCTPCAAGYSSPSGSAECFECGPGTFSTIRSGDCLPCAPGSSSSATAQPDRCPLCPRGFHQPQPGQLSCRQCQPGMYADRNGMTSCSSCRPGYFSNDTARETDCDMCNGGWFSSNWGETECRICPVGHFSFPGSSVCSRCAKGSSSNVEGRSSDCPLCSKGYFQSAEGQTTCQPCPEGEYSDVDGATQCKKCPQGTRQNLTAQISNASCIACPPGTYSKNDGSDECSPCLRGHYCDEEGMKQPKPCPIGTAVNETGSASVAECLPCPEGEFAPLPGLPVCNPCSSGFYLNSSQHGTSNQTECFPCAAGSYSEGIRNSYCELCPPGTFTGDILAGASRAVCLPCTRGTYSNRSGTVFCDHCPSGQNSFPGATACMTVSVELTMTPSLEFTETASLNGTYSEEKTFTESLEGTETVTPTNTTSVADTITPQKSDNTTTETVSETLSDEDFTRTITRSKNTKTLSLSRRTQSNTSELTESELVTDSQSRSRKSASPSTSESLPPPCTGKLMLNISTIKFQNGRTLLNTKELLVDLKLFEHSLSLEEERNLPPGVVPVFFDMFIPNLSPSNFSLISKYPIRILEITSRQNRAVQLRLGLNTNDLHIDMVNPFTLEVGIKVGGLSCQDPQNRPENELFTVSNQIELKLRYAEIPTSLVLSSKIAGATSTAISAMAGNAAAVRTGLAQQRSNAIILAMQCAADPSSTIDFLGNPLQLEIGDDSVGHAILRGTIVGNIILNLSAMVLIFIFCAYTARKRNMTKKSILAGRQMPLKWYSRSVLASFFFPGYFFVTASILTQPTLTSAFGLFFNPSPTQFVLDIFIGVVGIAIIVAPLVYFMMAVFPVSKKIDPFLVSEKLTVVWKDQVPRQEWKKLKSDACYKDVNPKNGTASICVVTTKRNSLKNDTNDSQHQVLVMDDDDDSNKSSSNQEEEGNHEEILGMKKDDEKNKNNDNKNNNNNNNNKQPRKSSTSSSSENISSSSDPKTTTTTNTKTNKPPPAFTPPPLPLSTRLHRWFYEIRYPTEAWRTNTSPAWIGKIYLSRYGKIFDSMRRATVFFIAVDLIFSAILAILLSLSPEPGTLLCKMNRYLLSFMVAMLFAVPVATMPSNTPSENWFLITIGFTFAVQLAVALYGLLGPDEDSEQFLTVGEILDIVVVVLCSLKVAIVDFWDPLRDHILIPFIKFLGCIEIDATRSIHEVKYESLEEEIIKETEGKKEFSEELLSKLSPQKLLSLKQKTSLGKIANGETVKKIFGDYRNALLEGDNDEDLVDEELWWSDRLDRPLLASNGDDDDDDEEDSDDGRQEEMKSVVRMNLSNDKPPSASSSHEEPEEDDEEEDEDEDEEEYFEEEEEEESGTYGPRNVQTIREDSLI